MNTTFKNYGSLSIPITGSGVNQSDKQATRMVVKGIIEMDGTITGSLYNGDELLTHRRVYVMSKNMPFELSVDERIKLKGKEVI